MPKVTFIDPDGTRHDIDALPGATLMETAVDNDIEGIVAECGGACSCATCHVYVEEAWLDKVEPINPQEDGMLDCVPERQPNSRLSCQIEITDDIEGLIVHVPDSQY